MSALLKDRVAIVTGASSGIGEAAAVALSEAGMKLVLAARRTEKLEELAQRLGGDIIVQTTDVTSEADIEALFAVTVERFGTVDLLVNNAGMADHTATIELSLERWNQMLATNLTSAFLCSRAAFRIMKPNGRGRIINIGSISAKVPRFDNIAYASTKAALDAMTHTLALDGREHGITASILHPGITRTGLGRATGPRVPSQSMEAKTIGELIRTMAGLPDEANLINALILPIGQPFLGRG
jgi:NAD(P)-dependent dehydrogenase (short-subunit alcohol dehydrogenase family)